MGDPPRKKLADISNVVQNEKSKHNSIGSKEYIEMLQKENMALMKLLAERNKIIEISGAEIQKMRVNMQKLQQQNHQLAQSNSQRLTELNLGKDRVSTWMLQQLKTLQHELGCTNALIKAKKLEAEEMEKQEVCQQLNDEVKASMSVEVEDSSTGNEDNDKPANIKRTHQSRSLGSSKQVQSQEKAENKRPCVRRQSARFKPEVVKLDEDCSEVEDKCPPMVNLVQENGSTSFCVSSNELDTNPALRFESKEFGRSSLSRPSRQAAKKVQSYKEIPVNIKMRRPV